MNLLRIPGALADGGTGGAAVYRKLGQTKE
jgi:hypothetical protein